MTFIPNKSKYLYNATASLAPGATFSSGWLDMESVDKLQLAAFGVLGIKFDIESSSHPEGTGTYLNSTVNPIPIDFYLANFLCRQRYMNFTLENITASTLPLISLEIKASYGSSDKLSVFPNIIEPSDFSQAALVQSIGKGKQPDGDYVNTPADGTAFSTTDTLLAGGTFSSAWIDTDGWKNAELFINSDVTSVSNGVVINYSSDTNVGSPVIAASSSYTFAQGDIDNGFFVLRFPTMLDGFRIDYLNGDTAQSRFILDMNLRVESSQDVIKQSGDHHQNSKSFLFKVGVGQEVGHSSGTKFGFNSDIDTSSDPEDVWEGGGNYTGLPVTTSETINVFSSSSNDSSGGTGARTVTLYGLNQNWVEISETVTMNGTTAVTTVNQWRRMNRMKVKTGGSTGGNVGTITARHTTTTANVFATLPASRNQTAIAAMTVPLGKKLFILNYSVNMGRANGSAGSANVTLRVRPEGSVFQASRYNIVTDSLRWTENPETALGPFSEKTDIKFRVDSVSDNGSQVAATFEYMLIENGFV